MVGWQDNYFCDITGAYLAFHDKILPGEPSGLIVWADTDWFDVKRLTSRNTLIEPADTYIVSNHLKWRIISK